MKTTKTPTTGALSPTEARLMAVYRSLPRHVKATVRKIVIHLDQIWRDHRAGAR